MNIATTGNTNKRIVPSSQHFEHTDLGNAERLVHYYGDELRHCVGRGWFSFDGSRWIENGKGVMELAKQTVRRISDEGAGMPEALRSTIQKHARKSESTARLKGMMRLAESDPVISCTPIDFDSNPNLLNLPNGTFDLRAGKFREHRREDMLTMMAAMDYDAGADCPEFLGFLRWATHGNQDYIDFLQRALGYSIFGGAGEHLFVLYGPGGNGKGVLTYVVQAILGDYGQQAPNELFHKNRKDTHPCQFARLRGKRFVVAAECGPEYVFDSVTIKQLTGGDIIAAREMRQGYEEFRPSQKYWLSTNFLPTLIVVDKAVRRRLLVLPFTAQYDKPDESLKDRLVEREGAGILNWLLEGYRVYQQHGLNPPQVVQAATEDYFLQANPVERFAKEMCRQDMSAKIQVKTMHQHFLAWCADNGERAMSMRSFNSELLRLGYEKHRSTGNATFWFGVSCN